MRLTSATGIAWAGVGMAGASDGETQQPSVASPPTLGTAEFTRGTRPSSGMTRLLRVSGPLARVQRALPRSYRTRGGLRLEVDPIPTDYSGAESRQGDGWVPCGAGGSAHHIPTGEGHRQPVARARAGTATTDRGDTPRAPGANGASLPGHASCAAIERSVEQLWSLSQPGGSWT